MKISEALQLVANDYQPGVAGFYSAMREDPWQKAHDDLEGQMLLHRKAVTYADRMKPAAIAFVKKCRELIKAATPFVAHQPVPTIADAFHLGSEERVAMLRSLATNTCEGCGASQDVVMSMKGRRPFLACPSCDPQRAYTSGSQNHQNNHRNRWRAGLDLTSTRAD